MWLCVSPPRGPHPEIGPQCFRFPDQWKRSLRILLVSVRSPLIFINFREFQPNLHSLQSQEKTLIPGNNLDIDNRVSQ